MDITAVQESGGDDDNFISIHGRQVRNESGGVVSKISDLDYILRFLVLGQTELKYVTKRGEYMKFTDKTPVRRNIESLIGRGKGTRVVNLIQEVCKNFRNISQDTIIYCLALCARCDDISTKKEAYKILNDICRIPTHLFQFIEYYTILTQERLKRIDFDSVNEKEQKTRVKQEKLKARNEKREKEKKSVVRMKKLNPHAAYGWGRLFKAAIAKWFLSFESQPEYLAYLLTKYRRRCGWSVKTVIKLAHIKSPDRANGTIVTEKQRALGFILKYFRSNLKGARKEYMTDTLEDTSILKTVDRMMEDYDALRTCIGIDFIQKKITADIERVRTSPNHYPRITFEHLPTKVLARSSAADNAELWRALIPCMPGDALIRHTGFLTSLKIFDKDQSEDIFTATKDGFKTRLSKFIQKPTGPGDLRTCTTQRPVHPFKILMAILRYKSGSTFGSMWTPVNDVINVLEDAFEKSLESTSHSTSNEICIAVDVSGSMRKGINGNKNDNEIDCLTAAQAVAFTLAKNMQNIHVLAFNKEGHEVVKDVKEAKTFDEFLNKFKSTSPPYAEGSDCTEPLKWAQNKEKKDIDAFVIFTVHENVADRIEPVEALKLYRDFCRRDDVKLITCTMNASQISSRDPADRYMFDICGCDPNLPLLIYESLRKKQRQKV